MSSGGKTVSDETIQPECLRARGDLKVSDEAMDRMSQWWSEGFRDDGRNVSVVV